MSDGDVPLAGKRLLFASCYRVARRVGMFCPCHLVTCVVAVGYAGNSKQHLFGSNEAVEESDSDMESESSMCQVSIARCVLCQFYVFCRLRSFYRARTLNVSNMRSMLHDH